MSGDDERVIRTETVKKLALVPGDILHVRIGGEIGDEPYVPSHDDIVYIKGLWDQVLPAGVRAVFTHYLVDEQIIQPSIHLHRWPPKVGQIDAD